MMKTSQTEFEFVHYFEQSPDTSLILSTRANKSASRPWKSFNKAMQN